MKGPYDDIMYLPHHVSPSRAQMARADRAAQFSPFAALTEHGAAIRETARLTDQKIDLDETEKASLDDKFRLLMDRIEDHPEVTVTYFLPDERKSGGKYVTVSGNLKNVDPFSRELVMTDGSRIAVEDIFEIADGDFE